MLRLETRDVTSTPAAPRTIADAEAALFSQDWLPHPVALPPHIVTRALSDMMAGRTAENTANFAIDLLCAALVDEVPRRAQTVVSRLLDCGVSVETFYESYIPRAAARLGDMWVEDTIGFTGVTLGMTRLTEVFRSLSPRYLGRRPDNAPPAAHVGATARPGQRRALFALAPGEEHALGVVMAADQFQRAGWTVRVELRSDATQLESILRGQQFELVGLSAGSRRMLPVLQDTVARLRAAAHPATLFVLGGALAGLEADAAAACGVELAGNAATEILTELDRMENGG